MHVNIKLTKHAMYWCISIALVPSSAFGWRPRCWKLRIWDPFHRMMFFHCFGAASGPWSLPTWIPTAPSQNGNRCKYDFLSRDERGCAMCILFPRWLLRALLLIWLLIPIYLDYRFQILNYFMILLDFPVSTRVTSINSSPDWKRPKDKECCTKSRNLTTLGYCPLCHSTVAQLDARKGKVKGG